MASARIAGTLTAADWFKLSLTDAASDTQDWEKAARMFELRIRKRFIEPADTLIAVDYLLWLQERPKSDRSRA